MLNSFWTQIQPVLMDLLTVLVVAVGGYLTKLVSDHFGAKAAQSVNQLYQAGIDQAAGWLHIQLNLPPAPAPAGGLVGGAIGTAVAVTVNTPAVQKAVDYLKANYPDAVDAVQKATGQKLGDGELAQDIIGALGKLLAGKK